MTQAGDPAGCRRSEFAAALRSAEHQHGGPLLSRVQICGCRVYAEDPVIRDALLMDAGSEAGSVNERLREGISRFVKDCQPDLVRFVPHRRLGRGASGAGPERRHRIRDRPIARHRLRLRQIDDAILSSDEHRARREAEVINVGLRPQRDLGARLQSRHPNLHRSEQIVVCSDLDARVAGWARAGGEHEDARGKGRQDAQGGSVASSTHGLIVVPHRSLSRRSTKSPAPRPPANDPASLAARSLGRCKPPRKRPSEPDHMAGPRSSTTCSTGTDRWIASQTGQ